MRSVTFQIDSQLTNTAMVALALRGVCSLTPLTEPDINKLELCAVEIINNAIEHAYHQEAGHTVEVEVTFDDFVIEVSVNDWGTAMKPQQVQQGTFVLSSNDPSMWLDHGRGLPIVRHLMDNVDYQSKDGKNRFVMMKRLV